MARMWSDCALFFQLNGLPAAHAVTRMSGGLGAARLANHEAASDATWKYNRGSGRATDRVV